MKEEAKVNFALSYCNKGDALSWAHGLHKSKTVPKTWEDFKKAFTDRFKDPGERQVAAGQLSRLHKGKLSITQYNEQFNRLRLKAEFDETSHQNLLIDTYRRGLPRHYQTTISMQGTPPTDVKGWQTKALELETHRAYHRWRTRQSLRLYQVPEPRNQVDRFTPRRTDGYRTEHQTRRTTSSQAIPQQRTTRRISERTANATSVSQARPRSQELRTTHPTCSGCRTRTTLDTGTRRILQQSPIPRKTPAEILRSQSRS